MAIRTTSGAVEAILVKNYDGATTLTPFITAGSTMTDEIVVFAAEQELTALTDAKLEVIERWLSAHFYAVMAQLYKTKHSPGQSAVFQGDTAMFLESTTYGQMAMTLDPTGYLRAIGGREMKIARVKWLGKDPVDQSEYEPGIGR